MKGESEREVLSQDVERNLPRLIEMTQALVRVASPNPPSNTAAIAKATEALLATIPGIEVRSVEPEPGIVSLVARLRGKRSGAASDFQRPPRHLPDRRGGGMDGAAAERESCARDASTAAASPI